MTHILQMVPVQLILKQSFKLPQESVCAIIQETFNLATDRGLWLFLDVCINAIHSHKLSPDYCLQKYNCDYDCWKHSLLSESFIVQCDHSVSNP